MEDKSILWDDSTSRADRALLMAIVKKTVSGDDAHRKKCVDKIMATIQQSTWQEQYNHSSFVFCVYYASGVNLVEISLALHAQAVDALYFLMTKDSDNDNLTDKFRCVFKKVYGHKVRYEAADAIRVLRNNVMHTGAILGIEAAQSDKDREALQIFCEKQRSTGQLMTDRQMLVSLAGSFSYLVPDLVVRVLGLEWDDLSQNGLPPSRLEYFYAAAAKA